LKARPLRQLEDGQTLSPCEPHEATHIWIQTPGPFMNRFVPVQIKGTREGTGNWTWNGDVDYPTLKPSLLWAGVRETTDEDLERLDAGIPLDATKVVCHTWITDGKVQFLSDCTHDLVNQTVDLFDLK